MSWAHASGTNEQVPALGDAFADALDHVLSLIAALPSSCPLVLPDVRRALSRGFRTRSTIASTERRRSRSSRASIPGVRRKLSAA
jgi:hypothetical protein